jgi:hypothetical protein
MLLESAEVYWPATQHLYLPEPLTLVDFRKYLNEVERFSARRNDIAHGMVRKITEVSEFWQWASGDGSAPRKRFDPGTTYFLLPSSYASKILRPPKLQASSPMGTQSLIEGFVRGLIEKGPGEYKYNSLNVAHYGHEFTRLTKEGGELLQKMLDRPLALKPKHLRQ